MGVIQVAGILLVSLAALEARQSLPASAEAHRHLAEDLEAVGCCYLTDLGPLVARLDQAAAAARRFFALPEAEKLRSRIGLAPRHSGYVPFSESGLYADESEGRRYEAFDLGPEDAPGDSCPPAGGLFHGANLWPALPGFRETIYEYLLAVRAVSFAVTRALERLFGLAAGDLQGRMGRATSQLRLINYAGEALPAPATASDMGKHTDYEVFTLLYQTDSGLQVCDPGGSWREVPPREGTLVLLVGNLLEVLSNGRFRSTPHRVRQSAAARLSIPYFAALDFEAVVAPVNAPPGEWRYQPLVAGEHLLEQVTRDFAYLRRRLRDGTHRLPGGLPDANPFDRPEG